MKYIPLIAVADGIDGSNIGWALLHARKHFEGFMAAFGDAKGRLLAHDILEHQNGARAIGTVADELEALGGMYFVRGYNGQLHSAFHNCEEVLASDLHSIFTDSMLYEELYMPRIQQTYACEDFDEEIDAVFEIARPMIREEYRSIREDDGYLHCKDFLEQARHYMRRGYRKARKRFANEGQAGDYFYRVKDAGDKLWNADFEGERAYIAFDRWGSKVGQVKVEDPYAY